MDDLISRQAVNDALKQDAKVLGIEPYDKGYTPFDAIITVHDIPKAQPQRKGRWESGTDLDREWCICSECFHQQYDKTNYCPNCGADMREDGEEPKKCDTCQHEKERWFSRCADCSDFELWESKE